MVLLWRCVRRGRERERGKVCALHPSSPPSLPHPLSSPPPPSPPSSRKRVAVGIEERLQTGGSRTVPSTGVCLSCLCCCCMWWGLCPIDSPKPSLAAQLSLSALPLHSTSLHWQTDRGSRCFPQCDPPIPSTLPPHIPSHHPILSVPLMSFVPSPPQMLVSCTVCSPLSSHMFLYGENTPGNGLPMS